MSHPIKEIAADFVVETEQLKPYLRNVTPLLAVGELSLQLLVGEERLPVKTHTDGTASLLLSYKGYEGAVLSLDDSDGETLMVTQLQGANSKKSYRVTSGLKWTELFAHEVRKIAMHDLSPFVRLVMPAPYAIRGLTDELVEIQCEKSGTRGDGVEKFMQFINSAGLIFSKEEDMYVRDLKR